MSAERVRDGSRRRVVVTAVVAVVVAATAATGVWRWVGRDGAERSTASGSVDGPAGGPETIDGIAWTASAAQVVAAGPLVLVEDGRSEDGGVVALDGAAGRERWHYRDGPTSLVGVAAPEDVVVAQRHGDDGQDELVGLDLASGEGLWRRPIEDPLDVVVVDDLVIVWTDPFRLTALHAADRAVAWAQDERTLDPTCSESWRRHEDLLVGWASCVGLPAAVDWDTGELRWDVLDDRIWDESDDDVPVATDGTTGELVDGIYMIQGLGPDLEEVVVAVDAETGRQLWHQRGTATPAVGLDGRVLVTVDTDGDGSPDEVRALDARSGEPAWTSPLAEVARGGGHVEGESAVELATDGERAFAAFRSTAGDAVVVMLDPDGHEVDRVALSACDSPCEDGVALDPGALLTAGGHLLAVPGWIHGPGQVMPEDVSDPSPFVALG